MPLFDLLEESRMARRAKICTQFLTSYSRTYKPLASHDRTHCRKRKFKIPCYGLLPVPSRIQEFQNIIVYLNSSGHSRQLIGFITTSYFYSFIVMQPPSNSRWISVVAFR